MRGAAIALLLCLACNEAPPRAQWTVVVATDAPIPQLGDRLLVEVLAGDTLACPACRRVFAVGAEADWPLSFGVVPVEGELMVRARLHRADHIGSDGMPLGDALVDALGRLPATDAPMRVTLTLDMRCFGVQADLTDARTCDPETRQWIGAPTLTDEEALPQPGSWTGAASVPCPAEAPSGMVCVPGGLVLLGDPQSSPGAEETLSAMPERLVRLDPFAIDVDEMTIGQVRALLDAGALSAAPEVRSTDPKALGAACTYLGPSVSDNDALPVNCVSQMLATEICTAVGKRLPTEAEWEYVATNTGGETTYPWGYIDDPCSIAIIARGRFTEAYNPEPSACRSIGGEVLPWGPVAGGSETDVTVLGVRNMGGNVREWVADALAAYASSCWSGGAPELANPLCQTPDDPPSRSIRGGGWSSFSLYARSTERGGGPAGARDPNVGFRCALSFGSM